MQWLQHWLLKWQKKRLKYCTKCPHNLCEICLKKRFIPNNPTKQECHFNLCKKMVNSTHYLDEPIEDYKVKEDLEIRKLVMEVYYQQETEFETEEEYNENLEKIEHKIDQYIYYYNNE